MNSALTRYFMPSLPGWGEGIPFGTEVVCLSILFNHTELAAQGVPILWYQSQSMDIQVRWNLTWHSRSGLLTLNLL